MSKKEEINLEFTDTIALISFRLETLEDILFEKNIISIEEFKNKIFTKIDRGEISEVKERLKSYIDKTY